MERRRASEIQYRPGDEAPESGLYEVLHAGRAMEHMVFVRKQVFPGCSDCHDEVRYRLLWSVPHILEDEDFREP